VTVASLGTRSPADGEQYDAIQLDHVTRRFRDVEALRGITLRVRPGEIVAYLGPNGAGKTTTIDLILGLGTPTTGRVQILGRPPADAVRHGLIAAVQQSGGLLRDLTVGETVEYVSHLYARPRPVDEVLERAGLRGRRRHLVRACSGGEQQRLRFALALLADPLVLVLDEPTAGMDVEGRRDFWDAIRRDGPRGRTVLFATHYLEEADAYADRIVLLRQGRIVADGTAAEVKNLASGRVVRATLPQGDCRVLAGLPGTIHVEQRGETLLVTTSDSDRVARYLLTETDARDLEITPRGLEEAFLALTAGPSDERDAAARSRG
jgi:ABC-2 type transport system ATP-binding protein